MRFEGHRFSAATRVATVVLGLSLALAPALAEARAGSGFSGGSRGSRSFSSVPSTPTAPSVSPLQRSITTPQPSYVPPPNQQITPSPGFGSPYGARTGFFQRNPFMTGLFGGLVGAGLAGMLFGDGFGHFGIGSLLASIFQIALLVAALYFLMGFLRRRSAPVLAPAGAGTFPGAGPQPRPMAAGAASASPTMRDQIGLTDRDYGEFERLLVQIQQEWSTANLIAMRQHASPEMLSYFSEQLSANASRGVENHVANVIFLKGDLAEAWREREREYATVAMTWSCRDWTVRTGTDHTVEGSDRETVDVTEVWTFLRARAGGSWILSAIQQA